MGFVRSAFFPLVVVVLLVYLASQTLLDDRREERVAYGDLIRKVEGSPHTIADVTFSPRSQGIHVTLRDGSSLKSNYPTDAAQLEFQHLLQERNIHFDSKAKGTSFWQPLLTYLVPFAVFFGFWVYLVREVQTLKRRQEDPLIGARTAGWD